MTDDVIRRDANAMRRFLLPLALAIALVAAACGGESADQKALDSLRDRAASTFSDSEMEGLIREALSIAERNTDSALGDEAFEFSESHFLEIEVGTCDSSITAFFDEEVPELSGPLEVSNRDLNHYRCRLGFVASVPPPYRATRVLAAVHESLVSEASTAVGDLDQAVAERQAWIAEIRGAGSTGSSFYGALGDTGFEHRTERLRYLREIAAQTGEAPDFLTCWDSVVNATAFAGYHVTTHGTRIEDDTIVTSYSEQDVDAAAANTEELSGVIAPARACFPGT